MLWKYFECFYNNHFENHLCSKIVFFCIHQIVLIYKKCSNGIIHRCVVFKGDNMYKHVVFQDIFIVFEGEKYIN